MPTTSGCPGCAGTGSRLPTTPTWAARRTSPRGSAKGIGWMRGGEPRFVPYKRVLGGVGGELHQLPGRLSDAAGQGRVDGEGLGQPLDGEALFDGHGYGEDQL